MQRIDEGRNASDEWTIYSIGRFPDLTWDLRFFEATNGYFSVEARELFLPACQSDTGLRLSTRSWFDKIALRHSHAYHPLLSAQTWIRLPVGLIYAIVPVAAGAGIVVGGCVVDLAADGRGQLCELAVMGGIALMRTAPVVLEGALHPDLRHWEHVPAAFLITRGPSPTAEDCLPSHTRPARRFF